MDFIWEGNLGWDIVMPCLRTSHVDQVHEYPPGWSESLCPWSSQRMHIQNATSFNDTWWFRSSPTLKITVWELMQLYFGQNASHFNFWCPLIPHTRETSPFSGVMLTTVHLVNNCKAWTTILVITLSKVSSEHHIAITIYLVYPNAKYPLKTVSKEISTALVRFNMGMEVCGLHIYCPHSMFLRVVIIFDLLPPCSS